MRIVTQWAELPILVLLAAAVANALTTSAGMVQDTPLTTWWLYPTASSASTFKPVQVAVPNTVVGALVDAGYYPFDPFYGENLKRIDPRDFDQPWTYSTTFATPGAATDHAAQILYLDGINYRGNITLNGAVVADESVLFGALQRFEFDVTSLVSWTSLNNLSVSLMRPRRDPGQWRNKYPDLALSFDDWNPHPPDLSMGLWRPVGIRTVTPPVNRTQQADHTSLFTFDGFVAHTTLVSVEAADGSSTMTAYLNFSVAATYWGTTQNKTATFYIDLQSLLGDGQDSVLFTTDVVFAGHGAETRVVWSWEDFANLTLPNPPLWWPWQLHDSRPFFNGSIGVDIDRSPTIAASFRFALREATSELTQGGALQFYINKVPLNIRSGGWAPDMFQRENYARMLTDFVMIREMGLNAIRLEGNVMNEDFFDAADELGILVTPGLGCCDGWQHWGHWPEANYFVAAQSVRKQARRLGTHPSVVGFLLASDELPPVRVETMYRAVLAEEAWPNVIISSASQQTSYVSGPSGVKMVGPYSWEPPTYWLEDGDGLAGNGTMNYGGAWGFLTEGGPGEAPMTLNSWQRTVPQEHLWNETTRSMDEWWSFHMGCPFGHFRNLTFYSPPLDARYGESHSAETYLYRAQAANLEGIRSMYEAYSRNKHINATGVVQWQIKMAWPSHLWHLYDWYFVSGGGYYGAKRALEHVHAMYSYTDGGVWLINSAFDAVPGPIVVRAEVLLMDGSVAWSANATVTSLPADASLDLTDHLQVPKADIVAQLPSNSTFFVRLEWFTTASTAPADVPTAAWPATNWYWLSTRDDVIDWNASNGFRSPCTQWGDFGNLNTMLAMPNLTTTIEYGYLEAHPPRTAATTAWAPWAHGAKADVFGEGTPMLHVVVRNEGSGIVFLIHVRLLNTTSGHDVAPMLCDDNFFSLAPHESHRISCALVGANASDVSSNAKLVVETYNDRVSHAHRQQASLTVPLDASAMWKRATLPQ